MRALVSNIQCHIWFLIIVGSGGDFPMAQSEVYGAPHEIPALPPLQRRSGAQVKQAACGSSRDEARHIRR